MINGLNTYKTRWHMTSDRAIKPGLRAIREHFIAWEILINGCVLSILLERTVKGLRWHFRV